MEQSGNSDRSGEQRQRTTPHGHVLTELGGGEQLQISAYGTPVSIVAAKSLGAEQLTAGMETLPSGTEVPLHVHEHSEEMIFVHEGKGIARLGDEQFEVQPGATALVPRLAPHGFINPYQGQTLKILWVFPQPGLDYFFRALDDVARSDEDQKDQRVSETLERFQHIYTEV